MAHRCPLCVANVSDHLGPFCPECGSSLRETFEARVEAEDLEWDEPVPLTLNDLTPEPPDGLWDTAPKCLCSHAPSAHSAATGRCWSVVCGCLSFRLKEAS